MPAEVSIWLPRLPPPTRARGWQPSWGGSGQLDACRWRFAGMHHSTRDCFERGAEEDRTAWPYGENAPEMHHLFVHARGRAVNSGGSLRQICRRFPPSESGRQTGCPSKYRSGYVAPLNRSGFSSKGWGGRC